jgi:hypothetical protein
MMVKQGFEEPILNQRIYNQEGRARHGLRGFKGTQKNFTLIIFPTRARNCLHVLANLRI